jgi:hypothetical protein
MKTQLIAALLISSAVLSAPAFANGNANLGDDTSAWAGPSTMTRAEVRAELVASKSVKSDLQNANLEYPSLADNETTTRAAVRQQLASTSSRQSASYANQIYRAN